MALSYHEWRFKNRRLEAIFFPVGEDARVAIEAELAPEARHARERETRGYYLRPLSFKNPFKTCHVAARLAEVDPDAVRSHKPDMDTEEPAWIDAVLEEWVFYRDEESVSFWTGLPLEVVVAALEVLEERGEIQRSSGVDC